MSDPRSARYSGLMRSLAALLVGAALTLAFAPYGLWPLAVICPAALMALWTQASRPREGAWLGFCFGLGLFAAGTWWLYISIRVFGQAPLWVALLVMGALVLIMAGWYALLGFAVLRLLPVRGSWNLLAAVPAMWLLVEWCRGWFLSGFPWLSLGYSQTGTWLAGFAPVGGVYLVSALLLVAAGALVTLWRGKGRQRLVALALLLLPWPAGLALRSVEWTRPDAAPRTVAIVQGAIPQDMKWLETNRQNILDEYARLHHEALGAALIVWPESALPDLANLLPQYLGGIWSASEKAGSAVLMGVMRFEEGAPRGAENYYNSVLALGEGEAAFYDKRHLVPFGEYFPVPDWVRSWLRLLSLPNSDFTAGADEQPPLALGGFSAATSICYEDAYPAALRRAARAANLLVNVTNDAWFGRSSARYQHLQITRMRAAEARRPLLRAANDGVSAVIGPRGEIQAAAAEFTPAVLRAQVHTRSGDTPYLVAGNWPIISIAGLLVAWVTRRRWKLPRPAPV
ncbi:MAG: apolipoprotein N-acyltransferase [Steroidobacteraceae bacterium]